MKTYATDLIRRSVSAVDAGRALGLDINHSSRCKCPLHGGADYNMRLYDGDRGYYCFVCHARGDVIGLVEGVLGCTFTEAVKWLSDAFNLGVDIDAPVSKETLLRAKLLAKQRKQLQAQIRRTERAVYDTYLDACELYWEIDGIINRLAPKQEDEVWNKVFCEALMLKAEVVENLKEAEDMLNGWEKYEHAGK